MGEFLRTFRPDAAFVVEMVKKMMTRITGEQREKKRHFVRCNMINDHQIREGRVSLLLLILSRC